LSLECDQPNSKIRDLSLQAQARRFRSQGSVVRQLGGLTLDAIEELADKHF